MQTEKKATAQTQSAELEKYFAKQRNRCKCKRQPNAECSYGVTEHWTPNICYENRTLTIEMQHAKL